MVILQRFCASLPRALMILVPAGLLLFSAAGAFALPELLLRPDSPFKLWKVAGRRLKNKGPAKGGRSISVPGAGYWDLWRQCMRPRAAVMVTAVKFGRSPGSEVQRGSDLRGLDPAGCRSRGRFPGYRSRPAVSVYVFRQGREDAGFPGRLLLKEGKFLTFLSGKRMKIAGTALILAGEGLFCSSDDAGGRFRTKRFRRALWR